MENKLKNKTVLVTGGSRGIGKAIALNLAKKGSNLIINYVRNEKAALETVQEINNLGQKAIAIKADISDHDAINNMFINIKEEFETIDILINNAAFGGLGPFERMGKHIWNKTMELNTGGLLACSQKAVKLMPNGGKIINLSSLGSRVCMPNYIAIGTAKAAVETMTKYMALELYEKNIIVNAVSAGFVETDALKYFKNIEEMKEKAIEKTPAKRIGTPEDVANIVIFLCQEESNWIVGQTLIADGGFSLT